MTKYRFLENVNLQALHGMTVKVEVSENYIVLVHPRVGGGFTIIAQAVKPRGKSNGQPTDDGLPDAETLLARETFDE